MNNYLKLTKVMMKNESMDMPKSKNKKIIVGILGLFAVLLIFIPACILVGGISFIMTTAVIAAGGDTQGLAFILMFVSGFSIVFGLSVILNVFYFSNDMNYLLPFPLQPWEIIGAKFTVAYINESVMEFMVIFSALIGYLLAARISVAGILVTILGMITVPILPLVYCGIISIVMMTFTGFIKNKDSVHKIMGVATVLLVVAAFISVSAVGGMNIDNYAVSLTNGNNGLYNVLSIVFIHTVLLGKAMSKDAVALLMYVIVNLVATAVFLFVAQKLYFKGVVGLGASGKNSSVDVDCIVDRGMKVHSPKWSYFKKEMLMLFRTPAFLMNCVLINLLWPALMYAVYMLQGSSELFRTLLQDYRMGNDKMLVYVPTFIIVISILVTAANSLGASAVTREGTGYIFMKYIPLPLKDQLEIKALISVLISQVCLTIYILIAGILLKVSVGSIVLYIVLSLMGVVFVTFLGVLLDTINPKLLWDDEINALRGNSTIFFSMAYAMILGVVLVGLAYVLLEFTALSVGIIIGLIFGFMLILDIFAYVNCMNMGQDNLEE